MNLSEKAEQLAIVEAREKAGLPVYEKKQTTRRRSYDDSQFSNSHIGQEKFGQFMPTLKHETLDEILRKPLKPIIKRRKVNAMETLKAFIRSH